MEDAYVKEVNGILQFLEEHGFDKAAEALYAQLRESKREGNMHHDASRQAEASPASAPADDASDYVDERSADSASAGRQEAPPSRSV